MLDIPVPQKAKKPTTFHHNITSKEDKGERRRMRKNEAGRNETGSMKNALNAIAVFFGMKRATKLEILAALVGAGEWCCPPKDTRDLHGKLTCGVLQSIHTKKKNPQKLLRKCSHNARHPRLGFAKILTRPMPSPLPKKAGQTKPFVFGEVMLTDARSVGSHCCI